MSFMTTKFDEILLSGFRGVALTKKPKNTNKTALADRETNGLVKNFIVALDVLEEPN